MRIALAMFLVATAAAGLAAVLILPTESRPARPTWPSGTAETPPNGRPKLSRMRRVETVAKAQAMTAAELHPGPREVSETVVTGEDERPLGLVSPGPAPTGMVWVPGGRFTMGNAAAAPNQQDELPEHPAVIDGFWMDATEVTNRQFAAFVKATGYVTTSERQIDKEELRGQISEAQLAALPAEAFDPASVCFNSAFAPGSIDKSDPRWPYAVWSMVKGASWRHPEGPASTIENRMDHPVVHVSHDDALAYCAWAGKRLPTEAEWEYAARGSLADATYPWGENRNPGGKHLNNIWQGDFPYANTGDDGFKTTAPVKTFPANAYGLHEMSGNVWEWCSDWYRPDAYARSTIRNPAGPADSFDPQEPGIPKRVQRGGSFLCSDNYCVGYRVSARMKGDPKTGTSHCGFRCVVSGIDLTDYKALLARELMAGHEHHANKPLG